MGDPEQRRDLPEGPEDQPFRVLTPEQKRELTIDTMASWALDGLHPARETVESINEFLASGLTAGQYIEKLKEKWRQSEGD